MCLCVQGEVERQSVVWWFSKGLCFDDLLNPIKMQLVNMAVCADPAAYIEMPFNR